MNTMRIDCRKEAQKATTTLVRFRNKRSRYQCGKTSSTAQLSASTNHENAT